MVRGRIATPFFLVRLQGPPPALFIFVHIKLPLRPNTIQQNPLREAVMITKCFLNDESEAEQWDAFVESHPEGSPYHLSCWLRTIQKTYSFKPLMYVLKNGNGKISGIFPCFFIRSLFTGSRVVSLPFSDQCGPLFNDHHQEKDALAEIVEEHGNQVSYIEIRSPLSEESGFACHNYYKRHILQLSPDPSEVRKGINKRTIQYSIRKAKKVGVEIKEENNQFGIEEFYRLNMLTRKKHGVPSQPMKFFRNLFEYMVSKGYAFILLAFYDSKVIAASLFFKFKETLHYKYNASDPQYLSGAKPNHLLTWHAIEQGCLGGHRFLDFGRTSPDNKGLTRYKEMWGARPVDAPYYYYPRITGASATEESGKLYKTMTSIWRKLPEPILERIGPMIYKHTA